MKVLRVIHFGFELKLLGFRCQNGKYDIQQLAVFCNNDDVALHEQLRKFWEIEEAEKTYIQSEEDFYCEDFFKYTNRRQPNGHYIARLPFKENFQNNIRPL